ncbi:MAG: hypothetical protein ACF8XB_16980 [Planctomycetota bacterium JB042]
MRTIKDIIKSRRETHTRELLALWDYVAVDPVSAVAAQLPADIDAEEAAECSRRCRAIAITTSVRALRLHALLRTKEPPPSLPGRTDDPVRLSRHQRKLAAWALGSWAELLGAGAKQKPKKHLAWALAHAADQEAERTRPEMTTRRERWEFLRQEGTALKNAKGKPYEVPAFETYSRYVRKHEEWLRESDELPEKDGQGTVVRSEEI